MHKYKILYIHSLSSTEALFVGRRKENEVVLGGGGGWVEKNEKSGTAGHEQFQCTSNCLLLSLHALSFHPSLFPISKRKEASAEERVYFFLITTSLLSKYLKAVHFAVSGNELFSSSSSSSSSSSLLLLPCSQSWPVNPDVHKQRYRLLVKPAWQVELFWQSFSPQAFLTNKQTNKQTKCTTENKYENNSIRLRLVNDAKIAL